MLGTQLTIGVNISPLHAVVRGVGSALRMSAAAFNQEIDGSSAVRRVMGTHCYVHNTQLVASAVCVRSHSIGPRLARWLLVLQDRAHGSTFYATQEFLAYMLGVRRQGITEAALAMQRSGLVSYRRGELTVLDRKGLENAACDCYHTNRQLFEQLFGVHLFSVQ
jgi:CRP-like cAMP-binding protein